MEIQANYYQTLYKKSEIFFFFLLISVPEGYELILA